MLRGATEPDSLYHFEEMSQSPNERSKPITHWIGEGGGWLLRHVVSGLAATGITPNMFTFLGLAVNSWAAAEFAMGNFRRAAAILFLAGFLDLSLIHISPAFRNPLFKPAPKESLPTFPTIFTG